MNLEKRGIVASEITARPERFVDHEITVETVAVPDAAEDLDASWAAEEVHRGMEELSVHHRDVLTLFFLEDLSVEGMALVLGISKGTVKSRLFYAKRALGSAVEKSRSRS